MSTPFFLHITDHLNSLINHPTLFANDTCILISNHSLVNLETQSNGELKILSKWKIANRLTLNSCKTQSSSTIDPIQAKAPTFYVAPQQYI